MYEARTTNAQHQKGDVRIDGRAPSFTSAKTHAFIGSLLMLNTHQFWIRPFFCAIAHMLKVIMRTSQRNSETIEWRMSVKETNICNANWWALHLSSCTCTHIQKHFASGYEEGTVKNMYIYFFERCLVCVSVWVCISVCSKQMKPRREWAVTLVLDISTMCSFRILFCLLRSCYTHKHIWNTLTSRAHKRWYSFCSHTYTNASTHSLMSSAWRCCFFFFFIRSFSWIRRFGCYVLSSYSRIYT